MNKNMKNKIIVGNLQNVKYSTTAPSGCGASNSKYLSVISANSIKMLIIKN